MRDQLQAVLTSVYPFSEAEFDEVYQYFRHETVKRNGILLREGDTCHRFYFVGEGCIRVYFVNPKGSEKTRYIMPKNHIGTALASFIAQQPSVEWVDALMDTELLSISYTDFFKLHARLLSWQRFYQKMLEMAYSYQTGKIASLVTQTAKERFDQAMQQQPALFHTVSNKILASFLDMTPETLSRLKSG